MLKAYDDVEIDITFGFKEIIMDSWEGYCGAGSLCTTCIPTFSLLEGFFWEKKNLSQRVDWD